MTDRISMLQSIEPHRVLTDGDLDGITTAGILLRAFPDLIVGFGHPGGIRAGVFDDQIDSQTIICDLPSHPACGAVIDHHETNRADVEGVLNFWKATPSAARIAFEIVGESQDVSDLQEMIDWVDVLDGGKVSREDFLSNHPMVVLSRSIEASERPEAAQRIVRGIAEGWGIERILADPLVAESIHRREMEASKITKIIHDSLTVVNRIAIVRFDGTGIRTNGYRITAEAGDECDACIVIHGDVKGSLNGPTHPLSASFYTNSFLHSNGGLVDLTRLATAFDPHGGGHRDACGCRIQPLGDDGLREDREVETEDVNRNIAAWIDKWSNERVRNIG
ncbi:MAG TPA: hypothetical protein HA345_06630 [Candidatus Thalassarchaeaceae archaeon]|nr:MAG TPA: hypothetical protein D7H94_06615 [Candidatus Poseidoniales archaeon]HIH85069.1 hypothetical protein [Candidatus Thalassarchaeaceae archaeon]